MEVKPLTPDQIDAVVRVVTSFAHYGFIDPDGKFRESKLREWLSELEKV